MFNTLKYVKMLEEVGFSREQAETSTNILVEVMDDKFASKQDLKDLGQELRQEIKDLRQEMDFRFAQLESRLTIKLGTMLAASIAILTAIQKLT